MTWFCKMSNSLIFIFHIDKIGLIYTLITYKVYTCWITTSACSFAVPFNFIQGKWVLSLKVIDFFKKILHILEYWSYWYSACTSISLSETLGFLIMSQGSVVQYVVCVLFHIFLKQDVYAVHLYTTVGQAQTLQCHAFIQNHDTTLFPYTLVIFGF